MQPFSRVAGSMAMKAEVSSGNSTPFSVHNDDAPTIYVNGNPAPTDAVTRTLEHDLDALTTTNPMAGKTDKLSKLFADQAFFTVGASKSDITPFMLKKDAEAHAAKTGGKVVNFTDALKSAMSGG